MERIIFADTIKNISIQDFKGIYKRLLSKYEAWDDYEMYDIHFKCKNLPHTYTLAIEDLLDIDKVITELCDRLDIPCDDGIIENLKHVKQTVFIACLIEGEYLYITVS